jgi:hypothetical protein
MYPVSTGIFPQTLHSTVIREEPFLIRLNQHAELTGACCLRFSTAAPGKPVISGANQPAFGIKQLQALFLRRIIVFSTYSEEGRAMEE